MDLMLLGKGTMIRKKRIDSIDSLNMFAYSISFQRNVEFLSRGN